MTVDGAPLLASGRDADIYLLPDGRVLRRYRAVGGCGQGGTEHALGLR